MSHPSWFGMDMLGDEKMRELWERLGQAAGGSDVLQIRAFNAATRNGIASIEELEPVSYETIRGWRNVGEKTAFVIYAATTVTNGEPCERGNIVELYKAKMNAEADDGRA